MTDLRLRGVTVRFGDREVVREVDLDVPAGTWTSLIGPNGAGKSTLLRAVAGLERFEGEVALDGSPIERLQRRAIARAVALVPQRPLIPEGMAVGEYVVLGRTPHIPYLRVETPHDLRVARDVLDRLELTGFADRPLESLSGGELQRAVLARALAQEARVLLLDEPTSALDLGHQIDVLELLEELRRERALTILSAMHDLTLAGQFADRLAMLADGRLAMTGTAREVLTEEAILRHYGAEVRVVKEAGGAILVVPLRRRVVA